MINWIRFMYNGTSITIDGEAKDQFFALSKGRYIPHGTVMLLPISEDDQTVDVRSLLTYIWNLQDQYDLVIHHFEHLQADWERIPAWIRKIFLWFHKSKGVFKE